MIKGHTPAQDRINQKEFEKLCGLQCTLDEICSFFNVEDDTLNSWCKKTYKKTFSEVFKVKRGLGKISLRRNMFRLAENNSTMAIWLSKQHLGMKDNADVSRETIQRVQIINDLPKDDVDGTSQN